MLTEIQEIIKKNLPQEVGDVLKSKLTQADLDSKEVENLRKQIIDYKNQIKDLENTISEYRKFDIRNSNMDKREEELNKEKHNLDLEMLKFQLEVEKDKSVFTKEIALGLVRNTEYRRNIFDNTSEPGGRDQYGNSLYVNKIQNSTETKTEV